MNDIEELKRFVVAHTRAQNIPEARRDAVLSRVTSDREGEPGSWAREWAAEGRALEERSPLEAAACYNMARFPFVDGPTRQIALDRCVAAVDRWRCTVPGLERLDVELPRGRVSCWAGGLSETQPRPLVIVMGGIVSIKEQWAPIAQLAGRLGMAMLVAELPGVGQNTVPYDLRSAAEVFPGLLDAVADRADVRRTYAVALSFSGHLALHWAASDRRLRGLVTVGAPIHHFFRDAGWFAKLPRVTVDTLAHLTARSPAELPEYLHHWALDAASLSDLDIPVYYAVSRHDEIIPPVDPEFLARHLKQSHLVEYDDVHGLPGHTAMMRLWVPRSLLRLDGSRLPQRAVLGLLMGAMRLRRSGRVPVAAQAGI